MATLRVSRASWDLAPPPEAGRPNRSKDGPPERRTTVTKAPANPRYLRVDPGPRHIVLAVLKMIFIFVPWPRGSRGRVRTAIFLRKS